MTNNDKVQAIIDAANRERLASDFNRATHSGVVSCKNGRQAALIVALASRLGADRPERLGRGKVVYIRFPA